MVKMILCVQVASFYMGMTRMNSGGGQCIYCFVGGMHRTRKSEMERVNAGHISQTDVQKRGKSMPKLFYDCYRI